MAETKMRSLYPEEVSQEFRVTDRTTRAARLEARAGGRGVAGPTL